MQYIEYLKEGKGIHINPKNKGKFTTSAKAAGKSVLEHAKDVLNDPNATTLQKRRATFARNAKKFKHQGGGAVLKTENPNIIERGVKYLKRNIPKWKLKVRNTFTTNNSHLNYIPVLNEGDSYSNSIVVDKGRLHLYAYDLNNNLVFHTPVSTGMYEGNKALEGDSKTPVGKFLILSKERKDPKIFGSKEFWRTSYTDLNGLNAGIGIHGDAGHPENIGLPDSHGCIRMPNDSIQCFLSKAKPYRGLTVYILNENGKYKEGGALSPKERIKKHQFGGIANPFRGGYSFYNEEKSDYKNPVTISYDPDADETETITTSSTADTSSSTDFTEGYKSLFERIGLDTQSSETTSEHAEVETTPTDRGNRALGDYNNNWLNLRNTSDNWLGKTGSYKGFVRFQDAAHGFRAAGLNITNAVKKGYNTLSKLITRWAPASDGNNPVNYTKDVAKWSGIGENDVIDPTNKELMEKLMAAMAKKEVGYDANIEDIRAGLNMLG